jgi:hypothetical protein
MDLTCDPLKNWFFIHLSMNDLFNLFVLSHHYNVNYNKQFKIEWLTVSGNKYSLGCEQSMRKHLYSLIRINKLTYLCESLSAKETILRLVATYYIFNERLDTVWNELMKISGLLQISVIDKHINYICKECDVNITKIYIYSFNLTKYNITAIYKTFLKHATINDKVDIFNYMYNMSKTIFNTFNPNYQSLFIEACFNYSIQIIKYMLDNMDINPNEKCIINELNHSYHSYILPLSISKKTESWTNVAELLCKHDKVDCNINVGEPIKLAVSTHNNKILELLFQRIKIDDKQFNQLIFTSLENEDIEAVRILTSNSYTRDLKLDPYIVALVQEKIETFQSIMKVLTSI